MYCTGNVLDFFLVALVAHSRLFLLPDLLHTYLVNFCIFFAVVAGTELEKLLEFD